MVPSDKAIFYPLFGKILTKYLACFFLQFPPKKKHPKNVKFASYVNIFNTKMSGFRENDFFLQKNVGAMFLAFLLPSTSYQNAEKSLERFLRYAVTDEWTNE